MNRILLAAFAVLVGIDALIFGPLMTLVGIGVATIGALPFIVAVEAWRMRRDPNLHRWPSVARCRLCAQRIFAWQRKERRAIAVRVDNPACASVGISGSCLVHRGCKGTPTAEVSIRRPSQAA